MRSLFVGTIMMAMGTGAMGQVDAAGKWADSVLAELTPDERIAQLMVVRSSSQDASGKPVLFQEKVEDLVKFYNVGAICAFQGTPLQHAAMFNRLQAVAKTPVMITVDAEWGLGMRFGGVQNLPYQLTLGALPDATLVYETGKIIAEQCRRMNIHVNYAPVVDINNNPANPVIGVRSFGEDKYKVALFGTRIMEGMQDASVMACAKHFPGHGDVSVDSHYDLPVINKTRAQLDSLELYPFRQIFSKGIGSVMVAHLYIPSIDSTVNQATSLSYKNVTGIMRQELGYQGLTFTDALEMKGVSKFYPGGEAAVQSLVAGNDMLCLPGDVPAAIDAINAAITSGRLTRQLVDDKCRRVLVEKYRWVANHCGPVETINLDADLNKAVPALRNAVARQALTVLQQQPNWKPLAAAMPKQPLTYLQIGGKPNNAMATLMATQLKARLVYMPLDATEATAQQVLAKLMQAKGHVVVGMHGLGRNPAGNFGMGGLARLMVANVASTKATKTLLLFGNPYALGSLELKGFDNLAVGYEDDAIFNQAGFDWLTGKLEAVGTLPVTVGDYTFGSGVVKKNF
ncbi:MAG: glycoside hydrolase family 3 [Bacteroidetes bacterium]|nr:MAG: glycoside hydrolase family 3 [Bacteroidota bacterium]